jgi:hypothetical protein
MIILNSTTDKVQVVLGGAITTNQLRCFASYRDTTTTTIIPIRNAMNTNSGTAIDLVASPASSTQRVVDYISIYNSDTVNATVTLRFNDNGTTYEIIVVALGTGERLEYQEGQGFKVFTNAGALKTSLNQGNTPASTGLSTVVLGSDVINNNASANTIADVTGLSFAVISGTTYYFRFEIWYTAAATTTGSRWSINGPTTTNLVYTSQYSLSATTNTINTAVAYDIPAASSATSAATTGNISIIEGYITPSANGTVIARFASEITSSAITAKAGSMVSYQSVI